MSTGSVLAQFTITLSQAVSELVAVDWHTSDGTAQAGVDYAANKGVAMFAPGETAKTVDILVYGRAVGSEDRSFFVEMLPPVNAILGASIGECIIHVDTTGSAPVTQIIVPTGPQGPEGKSAYQTWLDLGNTGTEQDFIDSLSPSPEEIAEDVAPLIDVGDTVLTAEGTEGLSKPDATTVKAVARRVAYVGAARIATVVLADGDNLVAQSDLTGDTVDMGSVGLYPRIMRGASVLSPQWSVAADGRLLIKNAVAGDVLYVCQYDGVSAQAVLNQSKLIAIASREALRRSYKEAGYDLIGDFTDTGLLVSYVTDVVLWEPTGVAYSYNGGLPHTIGAGETPIGNPLWVAKDNQSLRNDLTASGGAGLIGSATYAQIRAYTGSSTNIACLGRDNIFDGAHGDFYRDPADTTSADNDGTCLIDALGRRWKRVFSGDVSLLWFCEYGDGVNDRTAGLIKAITYCATNGFTLNWPKGKYNFTNIAVAIPYGYFHWTASGKVELICTSNVVGNVGRAISLGGVANPTLHNFTTRDISLGEAKITLDSVSDIAIGDLLVIRNNHVVRGDHRGSWQEGQITQVTSLTGNVVGLDQDAYYQYRSGGNTTVTVTGATSGQSFSAAAFSVTSPPRDALYKLLGLTGANAGLTKMTTAYDDATKTFTVGSDAGTGFPNTPAVGDTFRLVRQAEAWAVKAATFNIVGDFHVKTSQGLITTATAGQVAYDGIVFEYCVNGLARFAYVENFPNTGITLLGCLRCTVLDTSLYGINRVHSGDGGTGDAVSIANSSYCTVENINVSCSRRGVDVGGSNWSSLYNNVGGITMRGGGVGYAGGIIFPSEGWTEFSYGFGSHGGAAETKYRNNVAADCFYGATIRGFNEIVSGCEIRGFSALPVRLYYGSGTTITDTHYVDGFTETTGPSNKWWKATNSGNRKLRPGAFIWMTKTYTLETPTVIKGCSAKSTTREFVVVDTEVVAPAKIDGVLISGCTLYVDNADAASGNTDAYMLRVNGGPALGDNFGLGGANQMILVGSNNTVSSGKLFHASGTCEGAVRKSEGVWEVWVEANTSQSFPVGKGNMAFCVDVINDGGPSFFAGLNMLLTPDSAVDGSPLAAMNKTNLVINATNIATPTKMGISIVNGRLYFNNGTATDIRATVRVATV